MATQESGHVICRQQRFEQDALLSSATADKAKARPRAWDGLGWNGLRACWG